MSNRENDIIVAFTDFGDIDKTIFMNILKNYSIRNNRSIKITTNIIEANYVFFSVFGYSNIFVPESCIKIFYTGENLRPDFNICDYAIGFDYFIYDDRYHRFPFYYLDEEKHKRLANRNLVSPSSKHKFCSFTVSNGNNANKIRENLFNEMNRYKKVDSGGKFLNNVGGPVSDKYLFDCLHKFSICCENSSFPGYTTEKIIDAFAARTIPIYWGDPLIKNVFNEKAFINVSDYKDIVSVVERVKEIDCNDDEYNKIITEPVFVSDEYSFEKQYDSLYEFICLILDQNQAEAQRYPRESYTVVYQRQLKKWYSDHIKMQKIRKINKPLKKLLSK